jgi:small subunit ribosomal protein S6
MPTNQVRRVYEAMFMVDSGDAAQWEDLTKHISGILTRHGAEVVGITRWDERKLAFTIARRKRGTYVLAFFALTKGEPVMEIEHDFLLSEKVLRSLVLKADHFTVADMRMQLGEDIVPAVADSLMAERGEKEALAAAAVAKPTVTSVEAEAAAPRGDDDGGRRRPRSERPMAVDFDDFDNNDKN